MTTTASELMLFGGLVKLRTARPTEGGVLTITDTRCLLSTRSCNLKLKIYKRETQQDEETGERFKVLVDSPLVDDHFHPEVDSHRTFLEWRETIWSFVLNRSLEIWESLPASRIESSIGKFTIKGKKSISGKLGSGNNKWFQRQGNNWVHLEAKDYKYAPAFRPLSQSALDACKTRARARFGNRI